jgi:ATP-dependent Clp protease ATP-binding subunit ClpA
VVFRTLTREQLTRVLDVELCKIQNRITVSQPGRQFIFRCTNAAREFLLKEGTDLKYGARHLKRALDRYLVYPLSNLVATGQVSLGDLLKVDLAASGRKLVFYKQRQTTALVAVNRSAGVS